MIGHMTGQIKPGPKQSPEEIINNNPNRLRKEILMTIDALHALSRQGLWRVLLFLVVSAIALCFRSLDLFGILPGAVQAALGDPPPASLIHIVLAVSTISGLILIAGRTTGDAKPGSGWLQFGMASVFYPIYAVSNVLDEVFPVVLFAGLTVLLLEYAAIAAQASRAIDEERERLGRMI